MKDNNDVITLRGIKKIYGKGEAEVRALDGIDLDIYKGEMISIMGPSGSGKSTLMNILGALDVPTEGDYYLDGVDMMTLSEDRLAEIRNKKIGFVFQNYNLLPKLTAIENVETPLIYNEDVPRNKRRDIALNALSLVDLDNRADHHPNELSGGQQQRVSIARALVNNPSFILGDEPTGNLDSKNSTLIMELFKKLNEENGLTIIIVTHSRDIALYTDRIVFIRDGKIENIEYREKTEQIKIN
jgi:putative ABC transport system ATP-binding protein